MTLEAIVSYENMDLKDFKLAMLLLDWKISEERRWCRWDKKIIRDVWFIKVDKTTESPTVTRIQQGQQSWHRACNSYEEAYEFIVKEM